MAVCLGVLGGSFPEVSWFGIGMLAVGAVLAYGADALCERLCPDVPERALLFRAVGLGVAIVGAVIALRIF